MVNVHAFPCSTQTSHTRVKVSKRPSLFEETEPERMGRVWVGKQRTGFWGQGRAWATAPKKERSVVCGWVGTHGQIQDQLGWIWEYILEKATGPMSREGPHDARESSAVIMMPKEVRGNCTSSWKHSVQHPAFFGSFHRLPWVELILDDGLEFGGWHLLFGDIYRHLQSTVTALVQTEVCCDAEGLWGVMGTILPSGRWAEPDVPAAQVEIRASWPWSWVVQQHLLSAEVMPRQHTRGFQRQKDTHLRPSLNCENGQVA